MVKIVYPSKVEHRPIECCLNELAIHKIQLGALVLSLSCLIKPIYFSVLVLKNDLLESVATVLLASYYRK
jgi:hypothetical protein